MTCGKQNLISDLIDLIFNPLFSTTLMLESLSLSFPAGLVVIEQLLCCRTLLSFGECPQLSKAVPRLFARSRYILYGPRFRFL